MRHPVVRAGLIVGLLIALLRAAEQGAGVAVALEFGTQVSDPQVLLYVLLINVAGIVLFFVYLGLYLLAGVLAARQTGSVGSGAFAGMLAGALAGIVGAAMSIGVYAAGFELTSQPTPTPGSPDEFGFLLVVAAVSAVIGIALDIGFGAGLGALGGLIGRSSYEKTHPAPPPLPGFYVAPWVYAPGAYPPPPPYWTSPYMPYPATVPAPQESSPWPTQYPSAGGYLPLPPPPAPPAPVDPSPSPPSEQGPSAGS